MKEDGDYNGIMHSGSEAIFYQESANVAKLDRLKDNLSINGLDTDLSNYQSLGEINRNGIYNNRLEKSIKRGLITQDQIETIMRDQWMMIPQKICGIKSRCLCSTRIWRRCFIQHLEHEYNLMLGQCCYNAMTDSFDRLQICGYKGCTERHRNRKSFHCSVCTKLLTKEKRISMEDAKAKRLREETRLKEEQEVQRLEAAAKAYRLRAESLYEMRSQISEAERNALRSLPNLRAVIAHKKLWDDLFDRHRIGDIVMPYGPFKGGRLSVVAEVGRRWCWEALKKGDMPEIIHEFMGEYLKWASYSRIPTGIYEALPTPSASQEL